ncbi:MAG TPA: hypothetical protein VGZ02_09435 [Candidatus Baltobacteraceae bacterium]|jgi:hypothetical protein|nr:hypothetical protein [Candidatus Baltobacteraceae bacterium]
MHNYLLRAAMAGVAFALCGTGMASAETSATRATVAQASPAPAATTTPNPLTYGGFVRAYYFTRTNASPYGLPQTTNVLNQASFNAAVSLHAAYSFANNWSAGGTYFYANPLNNCTTAADQLQVGGPCSGKTATFKSGGSSFLYPNVPTNPDNTLPGFEMSTLYEAYLQYKDANLFAKAGNMVFNSPWANPSDSRLKPVAFQGGDLSYKFNTNWTAEAAFMDRFEDRVDSAFVNSTLLTATNIADAPGAGSNLLLPKYSAVTTSGFGYGRLGYTANALTANLHFYDFVDIATAEWLDAKYTLTGQLKPYLALQAGNESNTGKGVIGKINSQVVGLQAGVTPVKNLDVTLGFDYMPIKSDTFSAGLPTGVTCNAVPAQPPAKTPAGNEIAVAAGSAPFMYFLPSGGTANCVVGPSGAATVYYGGWASPYTDSYATDPLFTTSISQGMADRRSPGTSGKVQATWYGDNKQIRFIASYALYAYGNSTTGVSPTQEDDLDATYFFSKVPKSGPYHGLSFRERYADRTQNFTQFYGGLPVFKYNRTQLEFDF